MPAVDKTLIRPGLVAALVVAVGATLWALFPGGDLEEEASSFRADAVSLAYLRNVVRAQPDHAGARLRLAEVERALGQWDEAEATVAPLVEAAGATGTAARRSRLEVALARLAAAPAGAPGRPALVEEAAARLVALASRYDDAGSGAAADLDRFASLALSLERPRLAATLYDRLARRDAAHRLRWLDEASRWYEASGALAEAAGRAAEAERAAGDSRERQRRRERVAALEQAQGRDARALTGALAGAPPGGARRPARAGKPRAARSLAVVAPLSATASAAPLSTAQAVADAQALHDAGRALALLQREGGARPPLDNLLAQVALLETLGQPLQALALLQAHDRRFAHDRSFGVRVVDVHERLGALEAALAASEALAARGGPTPADRRRQGELLYRLDRPEAALARLRGDLDRTPPDDTAYWRLVADVAWAAGATDEAARAYGHLWRGGGRATPVVAERLLGLASDAGRLDELVEVGLASWDRFGRPHHLLWAMEAAHAGARAATLSDLLSRAAAREAEFVAFPRYWQLKAEAARAAGRPELVDAALARAVALDPRAAQPRLDRLWLAVERRDARGVRARLGEVTDEDREDPRFWEVLAAAHESVGEIRQAEGFRRRERAQLLASLPDEVRRRPAHARTGHDGLLLPARVRLAMALDEGDQASVRAVLDGSGHELDLLERIDAERALGRDEKVWRLVRGARRGGDAPEVEDAFYLEEVREDLSMGRTRQVEATAGAMTLGPTDVLEQRVSAALRWDRLGLVLGPQVALRRVLAGGRPLADPRRFAEYELGALVERAGERDRTQVALGVHLLPEGALPHARLAEIARLSRALQLTVQGAWNELPRDMGTLRLVGVRGRADAEALWMLTDRDRVTVVTGVRRYGTRGGAPLGAGAAFAATAEHDVPLGGLLGSVRATAEGERLGLVRALPVELLGTFSRGTEVEDLLWRRMNSLGLGLHLERAPHAIVGRRLSLRTYADGWAGYVWPARRVFYSADAGLGLRLRDQDLAVRAFLQTNPRGFGERQMGLGLFYALGWL